jgi:TonB family protein
MKSTRPWTLILSCFLTIGLFSAFFRLMPGRAAGRIFSPIAIRIRTGSRVSPPENKIHSVRSLPERPSLSRGGRRMGKVGGTSPLRKFGKETRDASPRILTTRSSNVSVNPMPAPGWSGEFRDDAVLFPAAGGSFSADDFQGEGGAGGSGGGPDKDEGGRAVPPQPSPAPPAPVDTGARLAAFQAMVSEKLNGARNYPLEARERREEGTVILSFLVNPDGQPSIPSALSSSGCASLDQAAVAAVASASPFLPFPEGFPSGIRVKARVRFYLSNLKGENK